MSKPLIGIVLDCESEGDYSEYPYYVLRRHYFEAISKAGGIPVGISHTLENIDDLVQVLDGLVMPGGDYDIPPSVYGDYDVHETVITKVGRLDFDFKITQKFLEADKPILGICAGEQLLAVMHGSKLIQDIESEVKDFVQHYNPNREVPTHEVIIEQNTVLHSIVGKERMDVNSHHHQAVKNTDGNLIVSARSRDGIIEAIEVVGKSFCLGVQWHPEFLIEANDIKIFEAFIVACSLKKK